MRVITTHHPLCTVENSWKTINLRNPKPIYKHHDFPEDSWNTRGYMRVPRIQGPRRVAAADFAQACLQIGSKPKYSKKKKKNFMMFLMKLNFFNTFVVPNHGVFQPWPSMAPRRGRLGAQRGTGRCCCSSGSLLDLAPQQHYRTALPELADVISILTEPFLGG